MVSGCDMDMYDRLQSTYHVARDERAREHPIHHNSRTREAVRRDIGVGDRQVGDRANGTGNETSIGKGEGDEPRERGELAHSVATSE